MLCKILVFRPVAIKLLAMLSKAEPDALAVADLIATDPGFSAEILATSNSAAFALHNRVDTVQKAVMILGTERTWKLVARTALQGMVQGMEADLSVENCWIHSRASAALAAWLAPQYQIPSRPRLHAGADARYWPPGPALQRTAAAMRKSWSGFRGPMKP